MLILKRVGLLAALTALASTPLLSQTQSPTPPSASTPSPTQPVPAPLPQTNPGTRPVVPGAGERNVIAPIKKSADRIAGFLL